MIRVVIADDQRAVRDGLAMLVGLDRRHRGRRHRRNGAEAVELARDLQPRRRPHGPAHARDGRRRGDPPDPLPRSPTPTCSSSPPTPTTTRCSPPSRPAPAATSPKTPAPKRSNAAIRAVAAGHTHLDPAIQQRLVAAVIDAAPARTGRPPTTSPPAKSKCSSSSPPASPTPKSPPRSSSAPPPSRPTSTTSSQDRRPRPRPSRPLRLPTRNRLTLRQREGRQYSCPSHAAARWYSWMRPPSRSWRGISPSAGRAVSFPGFGGRRSSARCGLWQL